MIMDWTKNFTSLSWSKQILHAGDPGGQDEDLTKTIIKFTVRKLVQQLDW